MATATGTVPVAPNVTDALSMPELMNDVPTAPPANEICAACSKFVPVTVIEIVEPVVPELGTTANTVGAGFVIVIPTGLEA